MSGKCKYPDSVCTNMTPYHGEVYCDGTPCFLRDEVPPKTNADRIRTMSDEELAEWLNYYACDEYLNPSEGWHKWLQQPAEEIE